MKEQMFDSSYNVNSILPTIYHPFDDHHLFNNFPSHLLDDDELFLDTILPYTTSSPPPPPPPQSTTIDESHTSNKDFAIEESCGEKYAPPKEIKKNQEGGGGSAKRRTGKKDRHSKIYTAQGPRDRRMRLSLQIARKFFDLQDMLGFDKASKTIEWLFNKSKAAIKDLSDSSCSNIIIPSSSSSLLLGDTNGDGNSNNNGKNKEKLSEKRMDKEIMGGNNNNKGVGMIKINKRKEARARARERTKEKLLIQKKGKTKESFEIEGNPNFLALTHESVIVEENDGLNGNNKVNHHQPLENHMASVGIIEKFVAGSSSLMVDFDNNHGGLTREFSMGSDQFGSSMEGPNFAFMNRTYHQGY